MRLEVVVDELVLRGLATHEARVAATALEDRLTALARSPGAGITARAEAFRRLPPVTAPGGSPAALGAVVAEAVWSALARGGAT